MLLVSWDHGLTPRWFSSVPWRFSDKMLRASKLWVYLVRAWENSLYRFPRTAPKYTEIVPETADHHSKHTHKHGNVKYVHKDTWLYLLNRMLHCYNSCTTLKPRYHYLVSDFNIGPKILHTLLPPEKQTKHLRSQDEEWQTFLECVVPFHQVFLVFISRHPLWPIPTQRNHMKKHKDFQPYFTTFQ